MRTRLAAAFVLFAVALPARTADEKPAIKVVDNVEPKKVEDDKELPYRFNDRKYVLELNRKLPGAEKLEKAILAALAKDKKHCEEVVYSPFGDSAAPEPIEVNVGSKVPPSVVRTILAELAATDLEFAVSVLDIDKNLGHFQRFYVGGYVKSGKKAIPRDKLKELLDPKLTHKQLLDAIGKLP